MTPRVRRTPAAGGAWLIGGGDMGKVVRAKDWSATPLGPIERWPQSLRTTVGLCLASNFPISLAWGPRHVQIYNDGYWPICGAKHPHAMGQDFSECWASAWPAIGEAFDRALTGETSYLENQRMFLDRNGYLEETFFTFSFSPIRDESGGVGGLFHPVIEMTSKTVGERRMRALRDVAARAGKARSTEEALTLAAEALSEFDLDVPFVLFYRLEGDGGAARLVARTAAWSEAIAIPSIDLGRDTDAAWPLAAAIHAQQPLQVDRLDARFGAFACGPYPETPPAALVLPIAPSGAERPLAVAVAGVSSRLPLNESYRVFYDLLMSAITSAVANAHAYEGERRRAEALAEVDRAKTAFFSNVSHEFRTPLTLMLGPLEEELAERARPLPAARRERLEVAHRNALRLLKLVNTLLDFSRIEAGRINASFEPTDLATFTAELASGFRSAIEKGGLTLTVDCPPLPEPVWVDRDMWEKIVLNLLSNAFKHTFAGDIRISLRWAGEQVELAVADSGVGIPAAELPRVFERFHRVKGTRARSHEGTGIGLALVQELCRAHGGAVRVESREGAGTTFTVTARTGRAHLPADRIGTQRAATSAAEHGSAYLAEALQWVDESPGGGQALALAAGAAAPTQPAEGTRPRVLLADDNADMRQYVQRLLADRYAVTAVADGAAALAAAQAAPPDLVLSDVMMPGLDGFALLRALRADERTRMTPVILLSARAGEESAVEGLAAGADDYLVKPFSARELLARVRTHLEMARVRREWEVELERRVAERTRELAAAQDVLRESEAAIRQLNAELEERVQQRTAQLEAANDDLEAFSYSVSHDLRAPLRTVDGFSQVVLEDYAGMLPEDGRRQLAVIRRGAQRMGTLIDDLLSFSRLGRQPLSTRPVDTAALVRDVLAELLAQQPTRKVEARVGELCPCAGDPALLRQVWINLLSNALKYTAQREQAVIEVGCACEGGVVTYSVRDNGIGFDMRHADKLFKVFQRLHRPEEFEGTGVGPAIVQRVVQRHHGRVWVEAAEGRGATFYFTLGGGTSH